VNYVSGIILVNYNTIDCGWSNKTEIIVDLWVANGRPAEVVLSHPPETGKFGVPVQVRILSNLLNMGT
jgi:hypothetical protein